MPTQHGIKIQDQIVIYDNRVNIGLSGLKKTDRDIFMACAYKLKNQKNVTIELGYTELMKLAQFKHMTLDEFHEYLKHDESVSDVKLTYEDPYGNIAKAPLFKLFLFDREKRAIRLKVNEEFINVFSVLTKNFTALDLVIYTSLKSKYSKVLYENLCQWRNKDTLCGFWDIPLADNERESQPVGFATLFGIPKSYMSNKKRIMDDIINPSIQELSPYMRITVKPKRGNGKGRPLIGYRFDFKEYRKRIVLSENAMDIENICNATGLSSKSIQTILQQAEKYGLTTEEAIELIQDVKKAKHIKNIGAYTVYLIQNKLDMHVSSESTHQNSFSDFPQRTYDFEKLEQELNGIAADNLSC